MIIRLPLALVLVTAATCGRPTTPSATPREPASTRETAAPRQVRDMLAPPLEPPCSLEGGASWLVDTVVRTHEPQPMRFVSGDENATLVLGVGIEDRWVDVGIERKSGPRVGPGGSVGASRYGERAPLEYALSDRWMYATSTWPDDGVVGVAIGDLRDAGFVTVLDRHVDNTSKVAIAPGHDGGWAVAWLRDSGISRWELHLALVRPDGSVRVSRTLADDLYTEEIALVRTPTGHAVICDHPDRGDRSALVAILVDGDGDPRKEALLTTEVNNRPRAVVDGLGIHVAFVREGQELGFLSIDFDGEIVTPSIVVWRERWMQGIGPDDLLVHRGHIWLIASSRDCTNHRCGKRAQVFALAISPEGRASRPIELDHGSFFWGDVALGRLGEDLVAAWYPDAESPSPLRVATLRCRE